MHLNSGASLLCVLIATNHVVFAAPIAENQAILAAPKVAIQVVTVPTSPSPPSSPQATSTAQTPNGQTKNLDTSEWESLNNAKSM